VETIKLLFSLLISFLITFYVVPILCAVAIKINAVDVPDGKIKMHKRPTPYLGGIGVFLGFLVALGLTLPFHNNLWLLVIGSTLLLFFGLIDDLIVMKPYQKFFGQIVVALCFLKAGFYLKEQFFYNYWNIGISFFWILSIINAFNLVDVMDGLATLIAICSTGSF